MNNTWYEKANIKNNWYLTGRHSENMDIPKCISCDNFIVQVSDNSSLCLQCSDYVQKRMTPEVIELLNGERGGMFFITEHIPDFSVITVNLKDEDILTVGTDWREALITDVIVEDYNKNLLEDIKGIFHKDLEKGLIFFIIELGQAMYPDLFDKDAIRANDVQLNKIINTVKHYGKHKHRSEVIAWKAIHEDDFLSWEKNGYLPKGQVFSLAEYFSFEKRNSTQKNWVLLKIFTNRGSVFRRRNKSVELKSDLKITNKNMEIQ